MSLNLVPSSWRKSLNRGPFLSVAMKTPKMAVQFWNFLRSAS